MSVFQTVLAQWIRLLKINVPAAILPKQFHRTQGRTHNRKHNVSTSCGEQRHNK